jgi:iron complex outermembrane receptor protein
LTAFGFNPHFPAGFPAVATQDYTVSKGMTPFIRNRDWGVSGTAVLSLDGVDLTSITAWRYQRTHFLDDLANTQVPWITSDNPRPRHFFYQELRAVSTGTGRFHYIGGATYLHNVLGLYSTIALLPPVSPGTTSFEKTVVNNWSIYFQGAYDVTDDFTITASGRYVHEKYVANFITPVVSGTTKIAKKFLPSVTLSYKLEGGGNVYARWARGFKGGGVNPVAPPSVFPAPNLGSTFDPEVVDTYEIGLRAPFLDRRLQLTSAIFYNDYSNLQVQAHSTPAHPEIIFAIVNAGGARTYGGEASIQWRAIDPLTLGINAGYLNAKYRDFSIPVNPILSAFNLSGATMINSPEFQFSFTADLDQPINDKYRVVSNVMVSHVSRVIFSQSGLQGVLPDAATPGYWLTNFRIGLRTSDDKYGVALYANNVFNKAYVVSGSSSAGSGNLFNWGKPRIIGGEITAKF